MTTCHSQTITMATVLPSQSKSRLSLYLSVNDKLSLMTSSTVKPRPEAHMDMILFEVFLKNIHLIPQDQIVQ